MSALPDLNGKVAVVTGGASGIGKGIAARLIAEGMRVIIADIEHDALEKAAAELGATAVLAGVSDAGSVAALAEVLAAELAAEGSKVGASVLCPGTVRTNIGASSRNRPPGLAGGGLTDVDVSGDDNPFFRWIGPEDAGAVVVRAIKRGDLYALTHPEWYAMVEPRHQAIAAAFRQAAEAS